MFALIIDDEVFIFDLHKAYGFAPLDETNLSGYFKILYFKDVLRHYYDYYFCEEEIIKITKYSIFLFRLCTNYLKDLQFV